MSTKPHNTIVVVWDAPTAIECGSEFQVVVGVKCVSQCEVDGWQLTVRDHDGNELAVAKPGDEPWPGTEALYFARVALRAPATEGSYTWAADVRAVDGNTPHAESSASFSGRAVPAPECSLRIVAIDARDGTPVAGAKVVVHPYRTFTDEKGVAEIRIPKGAYRLFVSGRDYFPFRSDGEVRADLVINTKLDADLGPSDAEVWS